jgi:hypothetical protein
MTTIPDLRAEMDKIELDQITILVGHIQTVFSEVYDYDGDINQWDTLNIQDEFSQLFTPQEFTRLMGTEMGKGILIGSWINEFVLGRIGEEMEECDH